MPLDTGYTASDPAIHGGYERFARTFSPARFAAYLEHLPPELTTHYRIATTPVFITRPRYERLFSIVDAVLGLLQHPSYEPYARARTPLPYAPLRREDYFGAVDFHISETTEKILEVNLFPPGFGSFIERMEHAFVAAFFPFDALLITGFEDRLCRAITAGCTDVAIVANDIARHHRLPEFRFVQALLAQRRIAAALVSADSPEVGSFERIFNRTIPSEWQARRDKLATLTHAFAAHPERMFTNPNGWYAADKRLLPLLSGLGDDPTFGLDRAARDLISAASLPTRILADLPDVASLEREFPHRRSVLKPISDYGSQRVLIKPSNMQQQRLFRDAADRYVAQALFQPSALPYVAPDGGASHPLKFDLKVVFLDGTPVGAFARIYEGPMTNFRRPHGGIAPVIVI